MGCELFWNKLFEFGFFKLTLDLLFTEGESNCFRTADDCSLLTAAVTEYMKFGLVKIPSVYRSIAENAPIISFNSKSLPNLLLTLV